MLNTKNRLKSRFPAQIFLFYILQYLCQSKIYLKVLNCTFTRTKWIVSLGKEHKVCYVL